MPTRDHFPTLFTALKSLLEPFTPQQVIQVDEAEQFSVDTPPTAQYPKGLFFGAVRINKNAVSYHLMPVYVFPDLLDGLSNTLRKRRQGKSCFNFTTIDEATKEELARLTAAGFARYQAGNLL